MMTPCTATIWPLPSPRRGVALIVVLWVMVILSLMVYSLGQAMRTEYAASVSHADRLKVLEIAKSGIDKAIAFVENEPSPVAGPLSTWQSNDTEFQSIPVGDGTFTLIHPYFDQEGVVQHGLWDESSKLSLNIANKDMLMKLPGMTEDLADSIIDWRDSDETASPRGAENPYYKSLQPPYSCKNGDFETVEELLYVRGMTPEILYGEDTNLNGLLDSNENDGDLNYPKDDADGQLDLGMFHMLTVYSHEANLTADGKKRTNLNKASEDELKKSLASALSSQQINDIINMRRIRRMFFSVADILDAPSINRDSFEKAVDLLTIVDNEDLPGLVNVNSAPKQVLLCLPGMDEALADKIIQHRSKSEKQLPTYAWLLDVMNKDKLKQFASFITTRSYVFMIDCVAVLNDKPVFKRVRAVADRTAVPAKVLYWKDLSSLGMTYR